MSQTTKHGQGTATVSGEVRLEVALVRLSHLVQRVFADVSREHGLTPQHTQLLCRLVDGPVGMAELGRMLDLGKSSLSGLVDRAEKRGLVTRVRETTDRRAYTVALTPHGLQVGNAAHEAVIARLGERLEDVDPSQRERLTALIMDVALEP